MSEILVQVIEGTTQETSRIFSPGAPVGPLGLGSAAEWKVEGPGVGPIHAYFYFDGSTLLAATAPPYTTTVNGTPLGGDWTPLPLPCELNLGGARFQIQNATAFADAGNTNTAASEIDDVPTSFLDRSSAALPPGSPLHHPSPPVNRRPAV
ncbi:MAG: hypothetical protein NZX77_22760, partial [Polyangiaceae bacterium]|nr:hypothetical protein [Polyangiaceae bacterium]